MTTSQPSTQHPIAIPGLPPFDPAWMMLPFLPFILWWLIWPQKRKPAEVGRARFATKVELAKSMEIAAKTINDPREFTLWAGRPDHFARDPRTGHITITPNKNTFFFRGINEHVLLDGRTGGGKSRFAGDRIADAGMHNGIPIIAMDLKGEEEYDGTDKAGKRFERCAPTSVLAALALEMGYEVFIIAPGFADSHCLNPMDLIKDKNDITSCSQLSRTQVVNYLPSGHHMDEWDTAGANVITAAIAYVKGLEKACDMVMVQSVIERLSSDPDSIMNGELTHYQRKAFSQYIAAIGSEKTAASIMFAAQGPASDYIKPEITATFCRPTNVPIILGRKQMLIFRVDSSYKKSVLPIMSAVMEMVCDRNIKAGNVSNGLIFFDELPQYKILSLSDILATARSQGWGVVGAIQGYKILANTYGELLSESIRENFSTEITFPINSDGTAKSISDSVGDEDIKASSYNSGKTSSTTTQDSTRKLLPAHLLKQIPPGTAMVSSQTIQIKEKGKTLVKVPIIHQFIIPKHEKEAIDRAKKYWIKYRKTAALQSVAVPFSENELKARDQYAAKLFPSLAKKRTNGKPPSKEQMDGFFSTKF
jgi:hypothetical protein